MGNVDCRQSAQGPKQDLARFSVHEPRPEAMTELVEQDRDEQDAGQHERRRWHGGPQRPATARGRLLITGFGLPEPLLAHDHDRQATAIADATRARTVKVTASAPAFGPVVEAARREAADLQEPKLCPSQLICIGDLADLKDMPGG